MDSVVPSTLPGHISTLKQYDYNIEKAKELLKEAGVENGFEVEFMYLANSTNNVSRTLTADVESGWCSPYIKTYGVRRANYIFK